MGGPVHQLFQEHYITEVFGREFAILEGLATLTGLAILHEGLAIPHGTLTLTLTLPLTLTLTLTPP